MPTAAKVLGVTFCLQDLDDLRRVRQTFDERINIRLAKEAGETDLIFRRQFLVPEKDNLVIQEGITDSGGIAVRQLTAQINACDLSA